MRVIKLKKFGFNALEELKNEKVTRNAMVNHLIDILGEIEEIKDLVSFKKLEKDTGLNDVSGIICNINEELIEKRGCVVAM